MNDEPFLYFLTFFCSLPAYGLGGRELTVDITFESGFTIVFPVIVLLVLDTQSQRQACMSAPVSLRYRQQKKSGGL